MVNQFKAPHLQPIILLGHQKSGTTAIAKLLGAAINKSVSIDPFYRTPDKEKQLPPIYINKELLGGCIKKNGFLYSEPIIKDPEFCFFYPELKSIYPNSKFVFIIRNPYDNIKSIFDRLKIPGDIKTFKEDEFPEVTATWDWQEILKGELINLKGKDIVETLALRWVQCTNVYLNNKADLVLVKYEEFRKDKIGSIHLLVSQLGEVGGRDISSVMNRQFQPKGKNTYIEADIFFSKENYATIERICDDLYKRLY